MKIDYLKEGSVDCPLLRIYGGGALQTKTFYEAVKALETTEIDFIDLHSLPGFEDAGCRLSLRVGHDEGVIQTSSSPAFVWLQEKPTWGTVAGLIEPFTTINEGNFYQWLAGSEAKLGLNVSKIALVFTNSKAGRW